MQLNWVFSSCNSSYRALFLRNVGFPFALHVMSCDLNENFNFAKSNLLKNHLMIFESKGEYLR